MRVAASWQFWAGLSAFFAALTAIFAKIGTRDLPSDLATFLRTVVVLAMLAAIVTATNAWRLPATLAPRSIIALVLSGLATGASWLCYFRALKIGEAARVAPVDKFSVVLVAIFGTVFLGERLSVVGWVGVTCIACGAALVASGR